MPLTLCRNASPAPPIEVEGLSPSALATLSAAEVARLPIPAGNTLAEVGDLFRVEGDAADEHLILEGDLRGVGRIGQALASGRLTVRGDAGGHLGAAMSGGSIEVFGSVGDWAGAEMLGGLLRIRGAAGHHLGSAYPGSRRGMRDGLILAEGPIGDEAGLAMRRGLIAVAGRAGHGLGRAMIAGSVFAFGPVGALPGVGMKRGTLALFGLESGDDPDRKLLPSFLPSGQHRPPIMTLYLRQLGAWGFPVPAATFTGQFARYNGDLVERGRGEVLVWDPR